MNSLNPVMRVREQIADAHARPRRCSCRRRERRRPGRRAARAGRPAAATSPTCYPHELSGGMKQRVCIAIAISLRPKVIIADEPTSALDVVVQRQVMETLRRVQEQLGASVILVGHDMGLMAQFVDRLGVMYAGKLAEVSPVARHLSRAAPSVHPAADREPAVARSERASSRASPACRRRCSTAPPGCPFHPRCPHAMPRCSVDDPAAARGQAGPLGGLPPVRRRRRPRRRSRGAA